LFARALRCHLDTTHYFKILKEKFTILKSRVKGHTAAAGAAVVGVVVAAMVVVVQLLPVIMKHHAMNTLVNVTPPPGKEPQVSFRYRDSFTF
jgi:hypothetical protein